MATFTSKAAGNWSASGQTTWNEVGVPGNGDTVTISHAITVDTNTTIGSSPGESAATKAIDLTGATLTISSGVKLTLRGDMQIGAATFVIGDGVMASGAATLEFDSSAAASPNSTSYFVKM